jgi:UDP-N-acetylmuramoyl-L-alanyl-D-glutamate--2,6-diaminopimelate ligase
VIIEVNSNEYKYITDNSKECNESTAFLNTQLSNKYIDDAITNGCAKVIEVDELKEQLESDIKIIGITGTNGKTTTAAAIYSILLDLGYNVALLGTRGFFINDEKVEDKTFTTPMPLELYSKIDLACKSKCEYFVMEVSSHAIAQERIKGLDFAIKVHTNITGDHLDYHGTLKEYIKVKNSFFADETPKIINKDDKNIKFNYHNAITYAMETAAVSKVMAYSLTEGLDAVVQYMNEVADFSSSLVGIFNIYNLLAAVSAVKVLTDKPLTEICEVVEEFAGVAGRMEAISFDPFIVVDFAHTHDGMKNVLESFQNKDSVVIFGAGGDRDVSKRALMGRVADSLAKNIIITNDNPRGEDPSKIINDILQGITNKDKVSIIEDRKEAIKRGIEMMKENSVLLVLGKGDETYQEINNQKIPYSDKDTILELIGE